MQLTYRPKFLPRETRTPFASRPAPEPFLAAAAEHADASRVYAGPALAYSADQGVCILKEEPALFGGYEVFPHPLDRPAPAPKAINWRVVIETAAIWLALGWAAAITLPPGVGQ